MKRHWPMKTIFLLVAIVLFIITPLASATEVCVDKYEFGAYSNTGSITVTHPSTTTADSAFGQTFRSYYNGANLTVAQVYLYQTSATGNVTAKIYGHTGIWSSSGVPNGTVLATSAEVTVTPYVAIGIVNFTFASGFVFDSSETYCLAIEGVSGDVNTVYYGQDASIYLHNGNQFFYDSAGWQATVTSDLLFAIYGEGGELVTFSMNGNTYITNVTQVTNVTSAPTVNVTTGDVNVGGVTAEFNNTAVTAGDVLATGNATLTGDVYTSGVGSSAENYTIISIMFFMIVADILLAGSKKSPILGFIFGIVSICIVAVAAGQASNIPFYPLPNVLLGLVAIVTIFASGLTIRGS